MTKNKHNTKISQSKNDFIFMIKSTFIAYL